MKRPIIIEEIKRNTNNYSYESLFRIIPLMWNNHKFTQEHIRSLYLDLIKINIKRLFKIIYISNII